MLNKFIIILCLIFFLGSCRDNGQEDPSCPKIKIRFSPGNEIETAIVQAIDHSQTSVYVQVYSFSSEPIADSLVRAKSRGETVAVIFDKGDSSSRKPLIGKLLEGGVEVLLDSSHPIAHNKTVVIDDKIVFTGSYNLTNGAKKNSENSVEIGSVSIAKTYMNNWELHRNHSEKY